MLASIQRACRNCQSFSGCVGKERTCPMMLLPRFVSTTRRRHACLPHIKMRVSVTATWWIISCLFIFSSSSSSSSSSFSHIPARSSLLNIHFFLHTYVHCLPAYQGALLLTASVVTPLPARVLWHGMVVEPASLVSAREPFVVPQSSASNTNLCSPLGRPVSA